MAKQDFYEFFLPSTIPDWKSAARAVAAGSIAGFIMFGVFAVISAILVIRQGSISHGKIAAIVLIVPLMDGFWTATRGIAALKRAATPKLDSNGSGAS
jgi:hypothetical protein